MILGQLPSANTARNEPKRFKTEIDISISFPFKIGNFPLKRNLKFFFYDNFFLSSFHSGMQQLAALFGGAQSSPVNPCELRERLSPSQENRN